MILPQSGSWGSRNRSARRVEVAVRLWGWFDRQIVDPVRTTAAVGVGRPLVGIRPQRSRCLCRLRRYIGNVGTTNPCGEWAAPVRGPRSELRNVRNFEIRALLRAERTLKRRSFPEKLEIAQLLVSEPTCNAITHGSGDVASLIEADNHCLHGEVLDSE